MLDSTDLPSDGNATFPLAQTLAEWVRQLGDRIHAANDAEARWRGWETTRRRGGMARTYHDCRLGSLMPCPRCTGIGQFYGEDQCRLCDGTGRLVRSARREDPGRPRW